MQFQQANTLEKHGPAEQVAASQAAMQPASVYPWDFLSPNRDEVLALLRPAIECAPFGWSQAHWLLVLDWDGPAALVGTARQIWQPAIQSLRQKRFRVDRPKQSLAVR